MQKIEWLDNYKVNIKRIDDEHKKLIEIINRLSSNFNINKEHEDLDTILVELIDYINMHFQTEEFLMSNSDYPSLFKHKKFHQSFTREVISQANKYNAGVIGVSEELLEYLKDWLLNHIIIDDKELAEHLIEKGYN